MVTVSIISKRRGYQPVRETKAGTKEVVHQLRDSIWALLFPFGIIAGLRIGMFTPPSEAGAVAVLYCIIVGKFIYKELGKEHIISA